MIYHFLTLFNIKFCQTEAINSKNNFNFFYDKIRNKGRAIISVSQFLSKVLEICYLKEWLGKCFETTILPLGCNS